jgi:hypothetical protein
MNNLNNTAPRQDLANKQWPFSQITHLRIFKRDAMRAGMHMLNFNYEDDIEMEKMYILYLSS